MAERRVVRHRALSGTTSPTHSPPPRRAAPALECFNSTARRPSPALSRCPRLVHMLHSPFFLAPLRLDSTLLTPVLPFLWHSTPSNPRATPSHPTSRSLLPPLHPRHHPTPSCTQHMELAEIRDQCAEAKRSVELLVTSVAAQENVRLPHPPAPYPSPHPSRTPASPHAPPRAPPKAPPVGRTPHKPPPKPHASPAPPSPGPPPPDQQRQIGLACGCGFRPTSPVRASLSKWISLSNYSIPSLYHR